MQTRNTLIGFVSAAAVLLGSAACSPINGKSTTIRPTSMETFEADPEAQIGSRNNPLPIGKYAVVNDWKIRVLSVNRDALKTVKALDPYSVSPDSNERFVLVNLQATFIGNESGEPNSDLRFKIVGSRGNTFSKNCGYSTNTFDSNGETFKGATIEGSLCFTVDTNQITHATISVQGDYYSNERKFLSLD